MFGFEYIWPLILIPVLVVVTYYVYRYGMQKSKDKAKLLGAVHMIKNAIKNTHPRQVYMSWLLITASVVALCIAIANPQWGYTESEAKVLASDIFIAIDISQSMNAKDVAPSRLEKAKAIAEEIILAHKGDRIAIILFAGRAYMQMPLTADVGAALTNVRSINTSMAGTQGTDIASAIDIAQKNIKDKSAASRAIIVMSDGEDHEEQAVSAAKSAIDNLLSVTTIAIGTVEGDMIPVDNENREDFKRDENGNAFISKVNVDMLTGIAKAGGGQIYDYSDTKSIIDGLEKDLANLSKEVQQVKSMSQANSYYWIFALIGLLLILTQIYGLKPNFLGNK